MTTKSQGNPPTQENLRRIFWELSSRYPIPNKGGDRIALASVSARLAHLNWSISEQTVEDLRQQVGAALDGARTVLRIYDVTDLFFRGVDAQTSMDVEVRSLVGNYYLQIPRMERELYAEIGFLQDGGFHALARSNTRYFDRDYPAQNQDPKAVYVGKAFRPSLEIDSLVDTPLLEKLSGELGKQYGDEALSLVMVDAGLDAQVSQILEQLCSGLAKLKVDAQHLSTPGPLPSSQTLLQVIRDRSGRMFESIVAKADKTRIDALHCHDWSSIPVGVRALEELGIPFLLTMRSTERERTGGKPTSFLSRTICDAEREGVSKAALIITPLASTRQDLTSSYGVSADKIVTIADPVLAEPNSFDHVILEHYLAYKQVLNQLREAASLGESDEQQSVIRATRKNSNSVRSKCRGIRSG